MEETETPPIERDARFLALLLANVATSEMRGHRYIIRAGGPGGSTATLTITSRRGRPIHMLVDSDGRHVFDPTGDAREAVTHLVRYIQCEQAAMDAIPGH